MSDFKFVAFCLIGGFASIVIFAPVYWKLMALVLGCANITCNKKDKSE